MDLTELHAIIANHAGEIADLFKRSAGMKVTILVRNPTANDGNIVVTDDTIDLAIAAMEKAKAQEARKLTPGDVLRSL